MLVVLVVLVVIAASSFVGCESGGEVPHASTTTTLPRLVVSEQSTGTTQLLRVGQELRVELHSTYWVLAEPTDTRVLQPETPPTTATGVSCPAFPGSGCGTVIATYVARHDGTAVLAAHRTTCGEALRCTGSDGDWNVTVHVAAR